MSDSRLVCGVGMGLCDRVKVRPRGVAFSGRNKAWTRMYRSEVRTQWKGWDGMDQNMSESALYGSEV